MNNNFLISNQYVPYVSSTPLNTAKKNQSDEAKQSFDSILEERIKQNKADLNFSKHAVSRIDSRQIEVTPKLIDDVANAVTVADEKGIKDALILNSDTAFIVNVPTRTVITTMNSHDMSKNVITNIDGTVIL